jgi:hypothetical protein
MLISSFFDDFTGGVESDYSAKELEDLMKIIEKDYAPPIQFNFIKV